MHMDSERGRYVRTRAQVEGRIEELIALLDAIDGDPDLEDGDDAEPDQDGEPTLGWPEAIRARLSHNGMFVQATDGESEDGGDREPDADGDDGSWPEVVDQSSREFHL